jgi:hypothetical protein
MRGKRGREEGERGYTQYFKYNNQTAIKTRYKPHPLTRNCQFRGKGDVFRKNYPLKTSPLFSIPLSP